MKNIDRFFIADAHCDSITAFSPDELGSGNIKSHWDVPRFKENADLQVMAFFLRPGDDEHAAWQWLHHLNRRLEEICKQQDIDVLTNAEQLFQQSRPQIMKAIEGLWFLNSSALADDLADIWQLGFRSLGLFWNGENWLGGGAGSTKGLNPASADALEIMRELGFVLDLAHASEKSFWQAIKLWQRPFMVSHTACAAITPHSRNLTDEQLKKIGDAGGVVGLAFYPFFLTGNSAADLTDVALHLRHMLNVAGMQAVCLGSDFDGVECLPQGIGGVESLSVLLEYLQKFGFSSAEIEAVAGENLRDFLRKNLPFR